MRQTLLRYVVFLLALAVAAPLRAAEKYALVIAIGHYLPDQGLDNLDGPGPDADGMLRALLTDYGFRQENLLILRDAQATRAAILDALDQLVARTHAGDYVLIYYSGHGTSPQDAATREWPIDGDTGALFPADFRRGSPQEMAARLVVGRRDLRPRLLQLDAKATVFAVLDTCFSANLMRGLMPRGTPKGLPLGRLALATRGPMEDDIRRQDLRDLADAPPSPPYPYRNVAWISAARAGESAVDIGIPVLQQDPGATLDGRPHGMLTNSVLEGLAGAADRDHDGVVTHAELYSYLLEKAKGWSQQPTWSAWEANRQLPASPALGGRKSPLPGPAAASRDTAPRDAAVRVLLEGDAAALLERLADASRISLVSSGGDLIVRPAAGGYRILTGSGVPLNEDPLPAADVAARLLAEPGVRSLLDWSYPRQQLNLELALFQNGQRSRQGLFLSGQKFDLAVRAPRQVWPLILDVDITGYVTVLYPHAPDANHPGVRGDEPVPAGDFTILGANTVSCPCGTEYLKAFAFDRKPAEYESWIGQGFPAADPRLKRLLDQLAPGVADARLRLSTNGDQ